MVPKLHFAFWMNIARDVAYAAIFLDIGAWNPLVELGWLLDTNYDGTHTDRPISFVVCLKWKGNFHREDYGFYMVFESLRILRYFGVCWRKTPGVEYCRVGRFFSNFSTSLLMNKSYRCSKFDGDPKQTLEIRVDRKRNLKLGEL